MSDDRDIEWAERIAVLELKVNTMQTGQDSINEKLDELLQLRAKGMGAFWLASALLGTGIIGLVLALVQWMKG